MKKCVAQADPRTAQDLIKKSTWVYRRTPRGRGKEGAKNARQTGAAKTPRFEANSWVASKL